MVVKKYLIVLVRDHLDVSIYELECLLNYFQLSYTINYFRNYAMIESNDVSLNDLEKISKMAGSVKTIEEIHHIVQLNDNKHSNLKDWNMVINGSYAIKTINMLNRVFRGAISEYIDDVYYSLKKPKVDLDNPSIKINLYYSNDLIIYSTTLYSIKREESKIDNPHSIKDYLVKFLINTTLIDINDKPRGNISFFDPFCGTGKILHFLSQLKDIIKYKSLKGYEISPKIVSSSNLIYPDISKFIEHKNSLNLSESNQESILITDPPYFRNTKGKKENYKEFYRTFFSNLSDGVKHISISFPNDFEVDLLFPSRYKIVKTFNIFIHKTLIRTIYILKSD